MVRLGKCFPTLKFNTIQSMAPTKAWGQAYLYSQENFNLSFSSKKCHPLPMAGQNLSPWFQIKLDFSNAHRKISVRGVVGCRNRNKRIMWLPGIGWEEVGWMLEPCQVFHRASAELIRMGSLIWLWWKLLVESSKWKGVTAGFPWDLSCRSNDLYSHQLGDQEHDTRSVLLILVWRPKTVSFLIIFGISSHRRQTERGMPERRGKWWKWEVHSWWSMLKMHVLLLKYKEVGKSEKWRMWRFVVRSIGSLGACTPLFPYSSWIFQSLFI